MAPNAPEGRIAALEATMKHTSELSARDRQEMKDDLKGLAGAVTDGFAKINVKFDTMAGEMDELKLAYAKKEAETKGVMKVLAIMSSVGGGAIALLGKGVLQSAGILK